MSSKGNNTSQQYYYFFLGQKEQYDDVDCVHKRINYKAYDVFKAQ